MCDVQLYGDMMQQNNYRKAACDPHLCYWLPIQTTDDMNNQTWEPTTMQTDRQTDRLTDRQTDRQKDRQTDRTGQTDRQSNRHARFAF